MRILIVPIAYLNRSLSPVARTSFLASDLTDAGFEVAICGNKHYRRKGTVVYDTPTPPKTLSILKTNSFNTFEELLYKTKLSSFKYLTSEIDAIRAAIKTFRPDIIYCELSIAGIISAKLENIPCLTSYQTNLTRGSIKATYLEDINKVLSSYALTQITNIRDIFNLALFKFVESSSALSPCNEANIVYIGFTHNDEMISSYQPKVLVDLEDCPINTRHAIKVITDAFLGSKYKVLIQVNNHVLENNKNIHIRSSVNIRRQLSDTSVLIHSGSNANTLNAIMYQVPQIIIPNENIFNKYNAQRISKNGAGFSIRKEFYDVKHIYESFRALLDDPKYIDYTKNLYRQLSSIGGNQIIIHYLNAIYNKKKS